MLDFDKQAKTASIVAAGDRYLVNQKLTELETHVILVEVNVGFRDTEIKTIESLLEIKRVVDDLRKILDLH